MSRMTVASSSDNRLGIEAKFPRSIIMLLVIILQYFRNFHFSVLESLQNNLIYVSFSVNCKSDWTDENKEAEFYLNATDDIQI